MHIMESLNLGSWFDNPRGVNYLPNEEQDSALNPIPGYIPDKHPLDVMSLDADEPLPQRFPEFDTA